jgi:hypothetical protein
LSFTVLLMSDDTRTTSPEVLAVKVPAALAAEIKRQAREDDRTVSQYLPKLLTKVVPQQDDK